MGERSTSRMFAAVSIGLGLTEILAPDKIGAFLGLEHRGRLLRLFGLREIMTGVGLLAGGRSAPWMWARTGGDALDLALVASALSPNNPRRGRAAAVLAVLAAIALADAVVAAQMQADGD